MFFILIGENNTDKTKILEILDDSVNGHLINSPLKISSNGIYNDSFSHTG